MADTIDFESRRRRAENDPNKVRCAHCGGWIEARATRCPKCGVYFRGLAFQFSHEASDELIPERATRRRRMLVFVFILIVVLVVGTALYFR